MTQMTNEELAKALEDRAEFVVVSFGSSAMTSKEAAEVYKEAASRLRSFDQAQNLEIIKRDQDIAALKMNYKASLEANEHLRLDTRSWMQKVTDLQQSEADLANANRTLLQSISALKLASVNFKFSEPEGRPLHEKLAEVAQFPKEVPYVDSQAIVIQRLLSIIETLITKR